MNKVVNVQKTKENSHQRPQNVKLWEHLKARSILMEV